MDPFEERLEPEMRIVEEPPKSVEPPVSVSPEEPEAPVEPPPLPLSGEGSEAVVPVASKLREGESAMVFAAALQSAVSPEVKGLIERIMEGTEPYDVQMKPWQVQKFNAHHVNIVLLRAAGFRAREIMEVLDIKGTSTVSLALTHPYGRKLMHAILPENVISTLNVRSRLTSYASDVLERVYDIGMTTEDEDVAVKVGFGLLDRAGFSAAQKVVHKHGFKAPAKHLGDLMKVLQESNEVAALEVRVTDGSAAVNSSSSESGNAQSNGAQSSTGSHLSSGSIKTTDPQEVAA